MLEEGRPSVLTRRNFVLLAGAGFASCGSIYGFGGKEFWDTKEPAEWSSDEIARLMMKSPWAKAASAERASNRRNTAIGMGRSPRRRPPSTSMETTYKGMVVWESAAPVRAASGTKLPDGFEGQYVLGVSGVPLARSESKGALDRLRQITTLQTKNRQPLEAAGAQLQRENGTVYLFGFAKEALSLSRDDKEVVFTTHMGNLAFTAKFNPRDMLYHGELSI
jgi:hypothetical protein